jgi:hypothetical protein
MQNTAHNNVKKKIKNFIGSIAMEKSPALKTGF